MNAVIGTYDTFEKAVSAFNELKTAGYPVNNISVAGLLAHNKVENDGLHVDPQVAGKLVSSSLQLVSEAAIFAVPEFGYLFAAGGIIPTISRLNRRDQFAGISTILNEIGVDKELANEYTRTMEGGKYMIIAHGDSTQITMASEILEKHITYSLAAGNHVKKFNLGEWIKNLNTDFPLGG
jgi:hypothetical protein